MITDKLENIALYKNIPQDAVDFVLGLSKNIELGKHYINENIYANVESYSTKSVEDCRFEAHKNYIDIQLLLSGDEDIFYTDFGKLNISEPYNSERDIEFYADKVLQYPKITLDGTNFMMIYPHEAHAPQAGTGKKVLKVVVKVKLT